MEQNGKWLGGMGRDGAIPGGTGWDIMERYEMEWGDVG